jgi:hypothetical protein
LGFVVHVLQVEAGDQDKMPTITKFATGVRYFSLSLPMPALGGTGSRPVA